VLALSIARTRSCPGTKLPRSASGGNLRTYGPTAHRGPRAWFILFRPCLAVTQRPCAGQQGDASGCCMIFHLKLSAFFLIANLKPKLQTATLACSEKGRYIVHWISKTHRTRFLRTRTERSRHFSPLTDTAIGIIFILWSYP
jgi:hypothetical protein